MTYVVIMREKDEVTKKISSKQKLEIYGIGKQAELGDCNIK
jgi:hypothetical protein